MNAHIKKRAVNYIIIITSIALSGMVFTQSYWVKNALKLKEEQFNSRVKIAIKTVANRIFIHQCNNEVGSSVNDRLFSCNLQHHNILKIVSPKLLNSLISDEFTCMRISRDYEYGIFVKNTGHFILGNYKNHQAELLKSPHNVSLTCLYKTDALILAVYFPQERNIILHSIAFWLILSVIFLLVLVVGFSVTVLSLVKQKKLADIKTDFVNNMTHEFKTPIATVSLASEMLLKPAIIESDEKIQRYARIIYDENLRLKNQVEHVLQVALLEKGEFTLIFSEVDIHKLLVTVIGNFGLRIKERDGIIHFQPHAQHFIIRADSHHLENILYNLLDNAEKYSPLAPEITVITENNAKGILITIEDKGVGISPEYHKHVFKKLFRVPTGNLHDVKGFGLGLYYVQTIVETHGGYVTLRSEIRKGSRFTIFFPFESNFDKKQ
ncbi:MAG: HAMP domain-containing histidine kinase [Lentimicrobiaceae bacterium]|nr:HAMP domain-containing histidine kinase [Lentimicrobiaceae bacterium]